MPAYYIQNESPTSEELSEAFSQWNKVYSMDYMSRNSGKRQSNRDWLEKVFFERLYDIHPLSRQMQLHETDFLTDLTNVLFQQQRSRDEFLATINNFIKTPSYINLKSIEYVIVGDVLLHAIGTVLGEENFSQDVLLLWRKVYSVLLRHLIPQTIISERHRCAPPAPPSFGTVYTEEPSTAHVAPSPCDYSGITPISSVRRVPTLHLDTSTRVQSHGSQTQIHVSNECFNIAENGPSKVIYCREATVDDVMDFSEMS